MPLRHSRRSFLQATIAGLCLRPATGFAAETAPLAVRHLWPTDNSRIGPISEAAGLLFYAGDRSIGALSSTGGDQLWSHRHGFDGPAVFRPRLTASLMVTGGRHWLAAYDQTTGAEVWRYDARIQTGVPLVEEHALFFGDGHEIVALDTASGAERWRFAGIPDTLAAYAPAASVDTVFAGPGDGHLYALDRATGGLRWSKDIRRDWQYLRQITVAEGILVAGTYKEILAGIALEDGRRLWSFNAGNFINSQHVAGRAAHLWSPTGWVYAIDLASGKVRWRHQTTNYDGRAGNWASVLAEITSRGGQLHVLSMDNTLHVLDMGDGTELAARPVPGRIRHAVLPLADGSGFAFPTEDAEVLLTGAA